MGCMYTDVSHNQALRASYAQLVPYQRLTYTSIFSRAWPSHAYLLLLLLLLLFFSLHLLLHLFVPVCLLSFVHSFSVMTSCLRLCHFSRHSPRSLIGRFYSGRLSCRLRCYLYFVVSLYCCSSFVSFYARFLPPKVEVFKKKI